MITATATLTETISVTASLGGSVCSAATYTLVDTDTPPNTLGSGSIASGAAATIVAPAATLQQNTIQRKLIPSGTTFNLKTKLNGVADNGVWDGVDTIDFTSPACADATITVNTSPFGTAPSGGSLNVPVVNGGANAVGSIIAGEVVIANNATFINGTQVTDQEAEVDANIFVTLNGTQAGTWNAMTQTWEVTGVSCGSVSVAVSDATPNFGDSITITATPAGLTPTSYLFFAFDGTDITFIVEQAGAIANWTVSISGTFDIYALATDGAIEVYGFTSVTATSGLICDQIGVLPVYGVGLVRLSTTYTGVAASVMRSSDSAIASIPFDGEFIDEAALIAHVGVGSGFTAVLPNQFGSNDAQQGIAANIPSVVITGTIQRINGVACIFFDGTSDVLDMTTNVTFKHAFVVSAKTGNVNLAQYVLGGTGQGLSMGGTFDASFNNIQVFTSGGSLVSAVNNTTPHQVSFRMGVAGAGRLRIDGVTAATGTTSASMSINRIGGRPDATLRHVGRFGCAFMYTDVLTDAQELILEAATKSVFGTP